MKELPLIIFTLTMQAAIGAHLWGVIIRLKDKNAPAFRTNSLVALILSAVGMLASLIHLGKPYLALTSMANLSSSWLSREIFFSGGFFVLLAIVWWLERSDKASGVKNLCGILAGLAGIASVYAMSQLYMDTIITSWQSANTLIDFLVTTVILGTLVFYVTAGPEGRAQAPRMDLIILAVIMLQMVFVPNYIAGLGAAAGAGQESAALLVGSYGFIGMLRWLMLLGGVFLFVLSGAGKVDGGKAGVAYLAVTALVAGEFVGRFLFYATGIPIGIGIM